MPSATKIAPGSNDRLTLIIDTDPGHDDAFAILLALASERVTVLGLTAASGNIPVAQSAANARRVVELAGRPEIPVRQGERVPLIRPARHAYDIHGSTGMNGHDWPEPASPPLPGRAVDWIIETVRAAAPGTITLVALGPLTNLATAFRQAPDIVPLLKQIVLMGGGFFEGGNVTPAAEFNISVDPEAARIVFQAGAPLTIMPIDCTLGALMPIGWAEALEALGTNTGRACAGLVRFYEQHGNKKYGTAKRPLHDALAVAWLLWPELFQGRTCNIEVETLSPLTAGMTVVDWWGVSGRPANGLWLRHCDGDAVYARLLEHLARLP